MDTKEFKTQSEILEWPMPRINGNNQHKGKTIIALDGGYSAVKGVSPNKLFRFPSYAKKAPADFAIIGRPDDDDLQFRNNKTGEVWLVGKTAEGQMEVTDVESTTDASLYTRYRYNSEIYRVIMSTGIALGLLGTGLGNEIYLQTGLPSAYVKRDSEKLVQSLAGNYDISLKVGNKDWVDFQFDLDANHIDVMEQPKGTLNALVYEMDGKLSKDAMSLLKSAVIILDIGFGTEDTFSFRNGASTGHQSYNDTAMKSVFDYVIRNISEQYPVDVKVFELQKYLESGQIPFIDPDSEQIKMEYLDFTDMLFQANKKLCEKSIKRLLQEYDNLKDYTYLIVTGGTGESRIKQIQEQLAGIPKLKVVPGNLNSPDLSSVYSNVVGYYMFRHARLQSQLRSEAV